VIPCPSADGFRDPISHLPDFDNPNACRRALLAPLGINRHRSTLRKRVSRYGGFPVITQLRAWVVPLRNIAMPSKWILRHISDGKDKSRTDSRAAILHMLNYRNTALLMLYQSQNLKGATIEINRDK
jgi:hypothetical protein